MGINIAESLSGMVKILVDVFYGEYLEYSYQDNLPVVRCYSCHNKMKEISEHVFVCDKCYMKYEES